MFCITVQDLAFIPVGLQIGKDLHGSGQRVALPTGKQVAWFCCEKIQIFQENTFRPAGQNKNQAEISIRICFRADLFKGKTAGFFDPGKKFLNMIFIDGSDGTFAVRIIAGE